MRPFDRWPLFVSPEPETAAEVDRLNMARLSRLALLMLPLHAAHVVVFAFREEHTPVTRLWREGIIASHSFMIAVSLAMIGLTRKRTPTSPFSSWRARMLAPVAAGTYLAFGALVASMDQLVTPAITPLIITSVGVGAAVLLPPAVSLPLYILQGVTFAVAATFTQHIEEQLLSARVNALTLGFLGFGVSWVFYAARLRELRQLRLIQRQRLDLAVRNRALRRILTGRDRFLAIIAHDLRGPIGSIREGLDVLDTDYDEMDEAERRSMLQILGRAAARSFALLEDLLRWARSQTGHLPFRPEDFNLAELCREVVELVADRAGRKDIRLDVAIDMRLFVRADRSMIHSVLVNLVTNALKFTARGGLVRITTGACAEGIEISVEDSGTGLKAELLRALATGETVTSDRGTEGETGTGLGLLLSRQFLEQNGTRLAAENRPSGGSRFSFRLPVTVPLP